MTDDLCLRSFENGQYLQTGEWDVKKNRHQTLYIAKARLYVVHQNGPIDPVFRWLNENLVQRFYVTDTDTHKFCESYVYFESLEDAVLTLLLLQRIP